MRIEELDAVAAALDTTIVSASVLAGGFSHETSLLTLPGSRVVVRAGGPDPAIEAAVMALGRRHVPVPEVLLVLPGEGEQRRPVMVIEYVDGDLLSRVLADGDLDPRQAAALGAEVGGVIAAVSTETFGQRGFFAGADLGIKEERPWSQQLVEVAEGCTAAAPPGRLDAATRSAWIDLCAAHAPALENIDGHTRLVHADVNPKNILVSRPGPGDGWRVDAVLDWEFSYSGCPYADAANMARFGAGYPAGFLDGFAAGFADRLPEQPAGNWAHLGRVLDMFALSELMTRPAGHVVADQAADQIRRWVTRGVPG
jgi:aminoglycoside phosphotransferase (APT) family kinase protein